MATMAGLVLFSQPTFAKGKDSSECDKLNGQIDFTKQRFSEFLNHLQDFLDEENRSLLYQKLGKSCAGSYQDFLQSFQGDLQGMLNEQLKQNWLKEYHYNEDKKELRLVGKPKEECGCPLVKMRLTPVEFCNCSKGHVKHAYETVMETKADVRIDSSILRGDEQCCFTITFS